MVCKLLVSFLIVRYNIKLTPGRSREQEMSYPTQKKYYETAFAALGMHFSAITHINRISGTRDLESADVDQSQTRRHGGWQTDSSEAVYCGPIAREAMRAMAGFRPREREFFIPRAGIEVPGDLARQIFPQADEWLARVNAGRDCERNFAAIGFLDMMIYFREVILQDVAMLFDNLPDQFRPHPIFNNDIFLRYRLDLVSFSETAVGSDEMRLSEVVFD